MNHNTLSDDETYYSPSFFGPGKAIERNYDLMRNMLKDCADHLGFDEYDDQRALYIAICNEDVRELCLKYARLGYSLKTVEYPNPALFTGLKIDFYFGYTSDSAVHFYVLVDLEQHSVLRTVECYTRDLALFNGSIHGTKARCNMPKTKVRLVDNIPSLKTLMDLPRLEISYTM
jgi:hypothetical protein